MKSTASAALISAENTAASARPPTASGKLPEGIVLRSASSGFARIREHGARREAEDVTGIIGE